MQSHVREIVVQKKSLCESLLHPIARVRKKRSLCWNLEPSEAQVGTGKSLNFAFSSFC